MRKLSEMRGQMTKTPPVKNTDCDTSLSLILFENVLDSEKLLHSPEIQALVKLCFGEVNLSKAHTALMEDLHSLIGDEVYKGLRKTDGTTMIYPVKAKLTDLLEENHNPEYSGPLNVLLLKPDDTEHNILVLTTHWSDNLFRNDHSVVGVIGDTADIEDMIDKI